MFSYRSLLFMLLCAALLALWRARRQHWRRVLAEWKPLLLTTLAAYFLLSLVLTLHSCSTTPTPRTAHDSHADHPDR